MRATALALRLRARMDALEKECAQLREALSSERRFSATAFRKNTRLHAEVRRLRQALYAREAK